MIRGYRQKKPGEMQVFAKAKDLIDYTFQTTENLKRFPKRVRFTLTNRLQDKSLQVYENLIEANEIYPSSSNEFHQRRTLQRKAISMCRQIEFIVELCYYQGRIEERQLNYWGGLINEVVKLTVKWQQSDYNRFSELD